METIWHHLATTFFTWFTWFTIQYHASLCNTMQYHNNGWQGLAEVDRGWQWLIGVDGGWQGLAGVDGCWWWLTYLCHTGIIWPFLEKQPVWTQKILTVFNYSVFYHSQCFWQNFICFDFVDLPIFYEVSPQKCLYFLNLECKGCRHRKKHCS